MKQLHCVLVATFIVVLILFNLGTKLPNVQAQAPFAIVTFADISGTGSKAALAASGTCKWIQFISLAANTNIIRVGDTNITTSRGAAMAPGSGFTFLPSPSGNGVYSLSATFSLVQSGDTLSVTCGN